jgi:hypothetical protein
VLITRPGYADIIERSCRGLAFGRMRRVRLSHLTRRDIASILRQPPFSVQHERALLSIVQLSGGNPGRWRGTGRASVPGHRPGVR